jgi:ketosteroid isomerase-like protein
MTTSAQESPNVAAALALPRALERGLHGEDLRRLYDDSVISVEHPNPMSPHGSASDLDHIVAASTGGAALLASQRYDVRDVHESGNLVIFRYTWTGVIATDRGALRAGQELTAHVAAFATITNGRISHFETYDCYEPFDGSSPQRTASPSSDLQPKNGSTDTP